MESPPDPRIPVHLVTGWLGAGKTTLLNRLLAAPGGRRFAVLVNEFGEIGVDDRLVLRSEDDLVELQNGCICCTVRGDLVRTLHRLARPRGLLRRRRPFDRVLIETTGIAEPAPILRTFLVEEGVASHYRMGAVTTVVDARHAEAAFQERAAREQVAVADLLLLNKTDLAGASELDTLEQALRAMNPAAEILRTTRSRVEPARILDREPSPRPAPTAPAPHPAAHGLASVALREDRPLDELRVQLWLRSCVRLLRERLVRYKGFLHLHGQERRIVLQGVYDLFQAEPGEPWGTDPRRTELVFIGHGLDPGMLRRGLEACVAEV